MSVCCRGVAPANKAGESFTGSISVTGTITATGDITAYSDASLKTDIATISNALDLVNSLRGVSFTRIDSGNRGIGVIAQEVATVGGGTTTPSGRTARWAIGRRLPRRRRHHGCPPVPLRSTYGQPWWRRQTCTNNQSGPLSGGRSSPCLRALLLSLGTPNPLPTFIRRRLLPDTVGDWHGVPKRTFAPQRSAACLGMILRACYHRTIVQIDREQ